MLTSIAIITSALLFNICLIWPKTVAWLTFLYLVPLFYVALCKKATFAQGMLWGVVAYGVHFYYLFVLVHQRAHGSLRYLAVVFLVIYFSLYCGVWFYLMGMFSKYKYFSMSAFTLIYQYFIFKYSLFIFGLEGYVFTCNLLPLVNTAMISNVSIFGIWVLTACIVCFSLSLAYFLHIQKIKALLLSFIFLCPFLMGPSKTVKTPELFCEVGYIKLCCTINKTVFDIAQEIKYKIVELVNSNPKIKVIVTPESTFPFELNNYKEVINWWFCDLSNKNIHIFISAHRSDQKLYNTVYHLYNGKIINCYSKRRLVPFCEYIPSGWRFAKKLIVFEGESFDLSFKEAFFDIDGVIIKPYICSDFFLAGELDRSNSPIFLFMNESWFVASYIKELLYSYIKLKALESKRAILIAAHEKLSC